MHKKTIDIPHYETVQTGVDVKEIWVTSDGIEHDAETTAQWHEFQYRTQLRNTQFELPFEVRVCTLESREDLDRVLAYDCDYDHEPVDTSHLTFPCKVVIYKDDAHCNCGWDSTCNETITRICSIDDFKATVIQRLNAVEE